MKNAYKLIKGCIARDWETLSEAVLWGLFFLKNNHFAILCN